MILTKLTSSSLISLGQLCNDDCEILLNKTTILAIKNKKVILRGTRNPNDKLWDIPIQKREATNKNYTMPLIHPVIYQKMNTCLHNSWNKEQGEGLMKRHIKNKIKEKEVTTK